MPNIKNLLCSLTLAGTLLWVSAMGQAAESDHDHSFDNQAPTGKKAMQEEKAATGKAAKPETKAPIVIEADEIYFSDLTGNMFAKGKVIITQEKSKLTGELVRGNAKKNDIWIDDRANFTEPGVNLNGSQMYYNYGSSTGTIAGKTTGKIGRDFVVGEKVEFLPGEYIIYDGTMTGCPANVPDYHVSATKVEIWPDDKLIAYNAKFWIKDKVIYSMAKYQKSLRKDAQSEFPSVGYDNQDGFYIMQHLEYPVSDKVAVFADLNYYSEPGFKPVFGSVYSQKDYSVKVVQGDFRDYDKRWIKKEPEFRVDYFTHRIGSSPVTYSAYALYGKWTDQEKSSWHQDYYLYFNHDAIKFNKKLHLYLGTGVEHIRDSYNNSASNVFRYDATLYEYWTPKLTTWVGYHYTKNNYTLFEYNSNALSRQLDLGFSYAIDHMNTISVLQTYDLTNNRVYDRDYTWYRNLHCWQAAITYREKRGQFILDLAVTRF